MGKFKPFLIGTIVGAGVLFFTLQFHVVHTHDGIRIVPRTPQHGLGLAYADIRTWDAARWNDFPKLARALVANGASDLVAASVSADLMDSVSSDGPMDQLRGMLDADTAEDHDPLFDDPGFLPLRKDNEPTSFRSNTGSNSPGRSDMDDLLNAPFPRDANRQSGRSSDGTDLARSQRSAEGVFGNDRRDAFREPAADFESGFTEVPQPTERSTGTNAARRGLSREEETELLEEMLFGDDENTSSQPSSGRSDSYGMFQEVTSQLENRADEAMKRARNGLQDTIDRSVNRGAESISRFARGQIEDRLPNDVGAIFNDATRTAASEPTLPPELEALRNGFDPFIE